MGELISLADAKRERTPHISGTAKCVSCQHEWVAVAPTGTAQLECPECGLNKGHWALPVQHGDTVWVCYCGNDLFRINRYGQVYCVNCADVQSGFEQG